MKDAVPLDVRRQNQRCVRGFNTESCPQEMLVQPRRGTRQNDHDALVPSLLLAAFLRSGLLIVLGSFSSQFTQAELVTVSRQGTDLVLTWPSSPGQVFILQTRASLNTADPWVSLASDLPADTGATETSYILPGLLPPYSGGGDGGGGGTSPPLPQIFASDSFAPEHGPDLAEQAKKRKSIDFAPLPPDPRDRSTWTRWARTPESLALQASTASVSEPVHAFYRVVQQGIHFADLVNGAILSGTVIAPIEIRLVNYPEVTGVFVSMVSSDEPLPGAEVFFGITPYLQWDTTYIPNGTYQIEVTVSFGESFETIEEKSAPTTVAVANEIWFPEPFNRAGFLIDIQAQSIHVNGTFRIEVLSEGEFPIFELEGVLDSEGYITDQGSRGILLLNYDEITGEQYPDTFYEVSVKTAAQGQSLGASSNTTKQKIFAEPPWPTAGNGGSSYTQFAIGYQPVFGDPRLGGVSRIALQSMIQAIYASAQARPGNLGVVRGSDQYPFEIYGQAQFGALMVDLNQSLVRNLYYFGHGARNYIGNKESKKDLDIGWLDVETFNTFLKNTYDPLDGFTRGHPFRFVFLDGCETAKGGLCKAFGIPREKNVSRQRFLGKGLRLRSFMGWKGFVQSGVVGTFNNKHSNFIGYFFQGWLQANPEGQPRTIAQAFEYARTQGGTNPNGYGFADDLVIFGSPDLLWFDTLP